MGVERTKEEKELAGYRAHFEFLSSFAICIYIRDRRFCSKAKGFS